MGAYIPPGWPAGVHPPGSEDFESTAVGWLLDVVPPDYRLHGVLRRYPVALATMARYHSKACVEGARQGYRTARTELAGALPPHAIDTVLAAYRKEGARLAATAEAVDLVERALRGEVFTPRMSLPAAESRSEDPESAESRETRPETAEQRPVQAKAEQQAAAPTTGAKAAKERPASVTAEEEQPTGAKAEEERSAGAKAARAKAAGQKAGGAKAAGQKAGGAKAEAAERGRTGTAGQGRAGTAGQGRAETAGQGRAGARRNSAGAGGTI
jgi:outer membrane biosynthesis protein TonB